MLIAFQTKHSGEWGEPEYVECNPQDQGATVRENVLRLNQEVRVTYPPNKRYDVSVLNGHYSRPSHFE